MKYLILLSALLLSFNTFLFLSLNTIAEEIQVQYQLSMKNNITYTEVCLGDRLFVSTVTSNKHGWIHDATLVQVMDRNNIPAACNK